MEPFTIMININGKILEQLDANEYYLFSILLNYGKKSRPDNGVLKHRTGWALQKLQKVKNSLVKKGLIEVNAKFDRKDKSRGRASNEYKITTKLATKYNGIQMSDFHVIEIQLDENHVHEIQLDDFHVDNKVLKYSIIETLKLLKENKESKETFFDKRINKNLPFDVVTSSQTIKALFEGNDKAIILVKETFGIDVTDNDIKIAIHTFSTVAVSRYDKYKGIRSVEKLSNLFIKWIDSSIKYQKTQDSANCDNKPEVLDLEAYILQNNRPKDLKHMKRDGRFERWEKQLLDSKFKLSNIAKTKKNKNFTTMFLFDCCHMTLGNRLNGSNEQRRIESLIRWYEKLSDYNQNHGNLRELLKAKPQC